MTNLTALIIGWLLGGVVGSIITMWIHDRIELTRLRETRQGAKKANKVVKHKQLIYKGDTK